MNVSDATARIHIAHRLLPARDRQGRRQLGGLCKWWRGVCGRVCALVGIGGAGKPAIADSFGLSFYDAANPDAFFAHLADCLVEARAGASGCYEWTVGRWEKEAGLLLVRDGLGKVRNMGKRSGCFDRILDVRRRDPVLRAAQGLVAGVRLLIAGCLPPFEALAEGGPRSARSRSSHRHP